MLSVKAGQLLNIFLQHMFLSLTYFYIDKSEKWKLVVFGMEFRVVTNWWEALQLGANNLNHWEMQWEGNVKKICLYLHIAVIKEC